MRKLTQRFLGTLVAILIATAFGAWVGGSVGRHMVLFSATDDLDQYALQIRDEIEKSSTDSRRVLEKINHSPYARCSDQEVGYFRDLIYTSEYLKDGGRMRDGQIACSATFGRMRASAERYPPLAELKGGIRLYRDLPPLRVAGQSVTIIQQGDAYAVYDPFNLTSLRRASMHFAMFDRDLASGKIQWLVGAVPNPRYGSRMADGTEIGKRTLYATRCSLRFSSCYTTYTSFDEVFSAQSGELRSYKILSGFCGALFCLVCATLYRRNKAIEQQLRRAIRRNELRVAYQPIFDLTTGEIESAEALARWTDEDGYAISPEVFIKIAEDRGFVGDVTRAIVHQASRDLKKILQTYPAFRVNVNIAAADLRDPEFLPALEHALASEGVAAPALGIEITESSTARNQAAKETILQLRNRGHVVHIDDFGTGYSNLAYLHDLSVDVIKIDRAFTQSIGTDSVKVSIIPQIFSMANTLGLQVVVEGIETEQQAKYFAGLQPHVCAQGWLLCRPVPLEELMRMLGAAAAEGAERSA